MISASDTIAIPDTIGLVITKDAVETAAPAFWRTRLRAIETASSREMTHANAALFAR